MSKPDVLQSKGLLFSFVFLVSSFDGTTIRDKALAGSLLKHQMKLKALKFNDLSAFFMYQKAE